MATLTLPSFYPLPPFLLMAYQCSLQLVPLELHGRGHLLEDTDIQSGACLLLAEAHS